ncbi:electron transfer flavoprotein subunit alpha/FixB family protein [Ferrimonas lipolytica]|uniref:Electron transfer flavoprotein subunit alpha/FixB family protein n=1 Tax=Ferrimonas lipolytica TaxID=2724191 RepID=A0A6H1UEW1_9GAMM|nr:electron transfer flavoprotein subunit alpha/FixB family protein [Ferrimonas lipolytica]QIZ77368.1 electron transfer flavoprotein subunit alpha/FixB family protein [Ferrimonas lipolytica]
MNALLILHRHNHNEWARLLAATAKLNQGFDVIVCGLDADRLPIQPLHGEVLLLPVAAEAGPEVLSELLLPYCQKRSHIVAGTDHWGRDLMPRLAAQLDLPMISEVTAIAGPQQWSRPSWAGAIEQSIVGDGSSVLFTVRPQGFSPVSGDIAKDYQRLSVAELTPLVERTIEPSQSMRPQLTEAKTVIAVGRGACTEQLWPLVEALADKLEAAIGGTRPVIDSGWLPSELQVGQTGQLIAPERYIGLGISGATQHMAGIKQAKTVIAVNQDADAPLMQLADYALTGELDKVLPELLASI